jgi:FAD synthetase
MKDGLQVFLASNRITKAIIIGARSTDPFGDTMKPFQPTDEDWPAITRIHPILNWTYNDVWSVILECNLPYCNLYDQGFTYVILL